MDGMCEPVDPVSMIPMQPRDYLTLFALARGAGYPYGIAKLIEQESNGQVRVDQANLYRLMKRLKSVGLVEDVDGAENEDGTAERRRYYRLTRLGAEVARLEAARLARLTARARSVRLIPGVRCW